MTPEEQRLAEYLKRAMPEPPIWLSPEEITVPKGERSRKSWAMPILAAAAVVAVGVAVGAVATRHPVTRPPAASPAGDQESTGPASTGPARPTPSCQAQGASVTAPNVVGTNLAQAEGIVGQAGLTVSVSKQSSATPAGTVISQSPAAGTRLARGTAIELIESAGSTSGSTGSGTAGGTAGPAAIAGTASSAQAAVPPDCLVAVTVPSVIGMTELSAGQVLQTAGFSVDIFAEMPAGQSVPTGEVWSQTPAAGREVPRGTAITIDVALPRSSHG